MGAVNRIPLRAIERAGDRTIGGEHGFFDEPVSAVSFPHPRVDRMTILVDHDLDLRQLERNRARSKSSARQCLRDFIETAKGIRPFG